MACLSNARAGPRGSYTPRKPGDAGAGGTHKGSAALEEAAMDSRDAHV